MFREIWLTPVRDMEHDVSRNCEAMGAQPPPAGSPAAPGGPILTNLAHHEGDAAAVPSAGEVESGGSQEVTPVHTARSIADAMAPNAPPETPLADLQQGDNPVAVCQNWAVAVADDVEVGLKLARELGECRVRGIERLDVDSRNQKPVPAAGLQRLAAEYALTRPVHPRGRIAQIKALLHDALAKLNETDPADARLISNLFFGGDPGTELKTVRRSASELLKGAQNQYNEPSSERFLEIRNTAFRNFAEFLIEFVHKATRGRMADLSPPNVRAADAPVTQPPAEPVTRPDSLASRRIVHSQELVAVLLFSAEDPGDTDSVTITEHQKIIDERGRCWWAWFKAEYDTDHCPDIERRLERNCEVGLWARSEGLYYIAHCDRAVTSSAEPLGSPEPELTPEYYRRQAYPAWFSFRSIRPSSRAEFVERFGDLPLPTSTSTIYWSPQPVPQPVVNKAHGSAVLHISDLRFGEHHRWNTSSKPHRTFTTTEEAIARTLLIHNVDLASVGAVVICGNFTAEEPSTDAFDDALTFIDGLCGQLPHVTRNHVVILPGADDFGRPGDRERSVQTLYRDFYENLYGVGEHDISRMRRYEFDSFRLNVLPVNSVKMLGIHERDEGLFGYGYDSLLNVMRDDYLHNHGHTLVINAVAAHHHMLSTPVKLPETAPQEPIQARVMPGMHDARDLLAKLSANRVVLYLHGHLHEPDLYTLMSADGWQTLICSAGTAGASDGWLRSRYRDNPGNSLGVLDIDISGRQIIGRSFLYDEEFRPASSPHRQFTLKFD